MRVDDDVDLGGVHAGPAQCAEEVGAQPRQRRNMGPFTVIADAGVHHDGQSVDVDHPTLHDDPPPSGRRVVERRDQEVGVVLPRVWRRLGEQPGADVELPLEDAGDGRIAQLDAVGHASTLRCLGA
jgi:hypothetical protein